MGQPFEPPSGDGIESVELKSALEERYLAYALSTIMHRALPDARDGLKPVHRRILYGMRPARARPDAPRSRNAAKIVGDVMGDRSIRTATRRSMTRMVRLWRRISPQRYPLVDGQGNFGNIDGDNPAAYRYTEARHDRSRAAIARRHRRGHVSSSARQLRRPVERAGGAAGRPSRTCSPTAAQGIAVGMATSIPPHNAAELCDAALLPDRDQPDAKSKVSSLKWVKGPDFPTGGIVDRFQAEVDRRGLHGPGAARSAPGLALDPGGGRRAAPGWWSSPRFPWLACRRARIDREDRRADATRRSCRWSPTCATNRPRTCASCWSRARARSIP